MRRHKQSTATQDSKWRRPHCMSIYAGAWLPHSRCCTLSFLMMSFAVPYTLPDATRLQKWDQGKLYVGIRDWLLLPKGCCDNSLNIKVYPLIFGYVAPYPRVGQFPPFPPTFGLALHQSGLGVSILPHINLLGLISGNWAQNLDITTQIYNHCNKRLLI